MNSGIFARHEGHDMDMGSSSSSSSMMHMMPPFHFGGGDTLWFSGWAPTSAGAIFGASFGLFLLAAFYRLVLVATYQLNNALTVRSVQALERHYAALASRETQLQSSSSGESSSSAVKEKAIQMAKSRARNAPPFMLSHELARGTLAVVSAAVGYLLMLAVMTSNLYYFFAILLGVFAGEIIFGRFGIMSNGAH